MSNSPPRLEMPPRGFRLEHDSLGEIFIPERAYYGAQTQRAVDNFPFRTNPIGRFAELVVSLAVIKKAAALANHELGQMSRNFARAIARACDEIASGQLHEEFVVDLIQGGAGTSTNMNANEVIANRALELLGHPRGAYDVLHPNNHVNLAQSTNDVYPTALKLALRAMLLRLRDAVQLLADEFAAKGREFRDGIKMGRTQLQDAVPMTLGRTFAAYASTLGEEPQRIDESRALLTELNIGGTAIGTGINTHPRYREVVTSYICEITGEPYRSATDLVEATQDTGVFLHVAGVLKRTSTKLSKICSDLRLLSSGPRAGLNEINLPARQPGSSIMPGKVNPVIPEAVNEVAFIVAGNDVAITIASGNGQLELNAFEPVMAAKLFESIDLLTTACRVLREKCVRGITPNVEVCREQVMRSIGLVTALVPRLGYEQCAELAREALATGESVADVVRRRGLLDEAALVAALDPACMLGPNLSGAAHGG